MDFLDLDKKAIELLAVAYLLDGSEAKSYLCNDSKNGKKFLKIISEMEKVDSKENVALMGTFLREAINSN